MNKSHRISDPVALSFAPSPHEKSGRFLNIYLLGLAGNLISLNCSDCDGVYNIFNQSTA